MAETNLPVIEMKAKFESNNKRVSNARSELYQAWLKFGEAWGELEDAITEQHGIRLAAPLIVKEKTIDLLPEERIELVGTVALQLAELRSGVQSMVTVAMHASRAIQLAGGLE